MKLKNNPVFSEMAYSVFLFSLGLIAACHVEAANILGMFTVYSPSHNIIHMSLMRALADAGHNVTVVTLLPLKDPNPNYHHIYIPPQEEDKRRLQEAFRKLSASKNALITWWDTFRALDLLNVVQQRVLQNAVFQKFLNNSGNHFDLMILGFGYNDYMLGIADHFKCHIIVTTVNVPIGAINKLVGNPEGVSYVPLPWLGNKPMRFFKRVANMLVFQLLSVVLQLQDHQLIKYYKANFPPERGYRSLDEMRKNVSLVFCSTFFSEGPIRPIVPNFIEIGGIQVKEKPDPLPKDIEDFLTTADNGVIFFSLGSNVKSADLKADTSQVIFNVLSRRKEKILWKWDSPHNPGNASNIMYKKWFAQDDILANPKTKLFITHGGKGSITESQHHGVPMLAIPIFGDQFANAKIMQSLGYGLIVDHHTLTEDQFRNQLTEVLTNASYSERIKRFSDLYQDRPMTSRKSVVYWTEYVLRHHGAKHMQSPRVNLNYFQYNSLDVIGFLLVVLYVGYYIVKYSVRYAIKLLYRKRKAYRKIE